MNPLAALKRWLGGGKRELLTAWFVARDARTPAPVKLLMWLVAAYAVSPVDAVPDVIPLLGYLDDIVIVPLGLAFALKLTPADVLHAARQHAGRIHGGVFMAIVAAILALWIALIWLLARWLIGGAGTAPA